MRTLAIAALSFSAAIFAACYLLPLSWLPWAALLCLLLAAALRLLRERWLRAFILAAFSLAFGFGWFAAYAQFTVRAAERTAGETREIRAVIVSWPQAYDGYTRMDIRLETEGLPRLKALLYDNKKELTEAEPGDRITLTARLRTADTLYGERYYGYQARGVFLIASGKAGIVREKGGFSLSTLPIRINHAVSERVKLLFPEDTAAFFQALMLGDKTELYEEDGLYLSFCRAGLAHVMAVSGMHIVFLVSMIQSVFGRSRKSSLACIGIVWLFVLVTGAGPSAVRAGFMQTLLLLAPILKRETDPVTSLSAALGLILLRTPYAGASSSLQLSFASLAGILCFGRRMSEPIYDRFPVLESSYLGRTAVGAVVNSLSVMPFTIPLVAVHFGSVSLLSPLSNLLCLFVVSLCFSCAYFVCGLSLLFPPAAHLLARLLAWPARYLFFVARGVSRLPFSAVYLREKGTALWLLLTYLLFIAVRLLKPKKRLVTALPVLCSVLALALMLAAARLDYTRGPATIAALDIGQGQCLCVLAEKHGLVIDCGGLGTTDDAGEIAGAYLLARGHGKLDALLLTHLDRDHSNGAASLLSLCSVQYVILPPDDGTEEETRGEIAALADQCGAKLIVLSEDAQMDFGKIHARLFAPAENSRGNDCGVAALISLGTYDMLVTGDYSWKAENALLERCDNREMELYIAGHHGSKNASSESLLRSIGAETAIISCGYNTYGHPAQETLDRLSDCGYTVHRTDLEGSIELRIGS